MNVEDTIRSELKANADNFTEQLARAFSTIKTAQLVAFFYQSAKKTQ